MTRKFTLTLFAALLAATALMPVARADDNQGNQHSCVNPAGHARGWCKHNGGGNALTISGTPIAINGELVQFREDNGTPITIDQANLLRSGQGLQIGAHYSLQGYFSNNMFVAQGSGAYYGSSGQYPSNGYPYPGGTASVQGIITSLSGSRVTIMQGLFSSISINDQQALNNGTAQNLFIGRNVTAWGYWSGGTFFATSIG